MNRPRFEAIESDAKTVLQLELRLPNGLWIRKAFEFPRASLEGCEIHGRGEQYSAEITHRCQSRHILYEELASLVPTLVHGENNCWFGTLNKECNPKMTCLFDGAKLEFNVASTTVSEFGICFQRTAFVVEREKLDIDAFIHRQSSSADWSGWTRREPSDSERLRVNKRGREILYFVQPPPTECDLTVSDLRAEVCHTLQIADVRRISFVAGPFYWGPDFKEDGLGLYSNYFNADIVIDSRHMKTQRGAALIDVIENELQSHPT